MQAAALTSSALVSVNLSSCAAACSSLPGLQYTISNTEKDWTSGMSFCEIFVVQHVYIRTKGASLLLNGNRSLEFSKLYSLWDLCSLLIDKACD